MGCEKISPLAVESQARFGVSSAEFTSAKDRIEMKIRLFSGTSTPFADFAIKYKFFRIYSSRLFFQAFCTVVFKIQCNFADEFSEELSQ